ncbi:MAG: GerMN domain-containing protein [Eubacteriales bacterium]|nr:GerMN domain-containing protein [Eubacteriales bacterium]
MKKKLLLLCFCLLALVFLNACEQNPLTQAEATAVPDVPIALHSASATTTTEIEAVLYFRYLDTEMLAGEKRTLVVPKDESNEMAVLRALLDGPSAERIELRKLLQENVKIVDVTVSEQMLTITLNAAFLEDGIPQDWKTQTDWVTEAPLRRRLTVQSLVNTVTDNFSYEKVQLMIQRSDTATENLRLNRSYFLNDQTGPTDPQYRDETVLLTPYHTAFLVLKAWKEKDYQTLYNFTASYADYETKPIYESFCKTVDDAPSLTKFSVSPGTVLEDGAHAILSLDLDVLSGGSNLQITAYPIRLVRENGIWKINYSTLQKLLQVQ